MAEPTAEDLLEDVRLRAERLLPTLRGDGLLGDPLPFHVARRAIIDLADLCGLTTGVVQVRDRQASVGAFTDWAARIESGWSLADDRAELHDLLLRVQRQAIALRELLAALPSPDRDSAPEWITCTQKNVAEFLRVSPHTTGLVARLEREGRLESGREGRKYRVRFLDPAEHARFVDFVESS